MNSRNLCFVKKKQEMEYGWKAWRQQADIFQWDVHKKYCMLTFIIPCAGWELMMKLPIHLCDNYGALKSAHIMDLRLWKSAEPYLGWDITIDIPL